MNKINLILTISPSLKIDLRNGNLISYDTDIAKIDFDRRVIVSSGKFSRTSTKHVIKMASWLGMKMESSPNPPSVGFYKYELGEFEPSKTALDLNTRLSTFFLDSFKKYKSLGIALFLTYEQAKNSPKSKETLMKAVASMGIGFEDRKAIESIVRNLVRHGL